MKAHIKAKDLIGNLEYKELLSMIRNASDRSKTTQNGIYFITEDNGEEIFAPYYKIYDNALRISYGLREYGLKRGDKLIFQLKNEMNFITVFWACIIGGYVPVPLNTSKTVSMESEEMHKLLNVSKQLLGSKIICDIGTRETLVACEDIDNALLMSLEELRSCPYEENKVEVKVPSPDDIALIQFTSGSTGSPKGVVLTHQNMLFNIMQINEQTHSCEDDFVGNWMPLTHVMGLIMLHLTPLSVCSNQMKMLPEIFIKKPKLFMEKLTEHKISITALPNFAVVWLKDNIQDEDVKDYDLSHLRCIYNGAEPIFAHAIEAFNHKFQQCHLRENAVHAFYGMSEAGVTITIQDIEDSFVKYRINKDAYVEKNEITYEERENEYIELVSCGSPVRGMEIKILDDHDHILPENTIGDVVVKGPNVTKGYFNIDNEKNNTFADGFLRTGDLGFINDGKLIITGRRKDLIFFNGQNFYAHDLERICEELPDIDFREIVACGVTNFKNNKEELLIFIKSDTDLRDFLQLSSKVRGHVNRSIQQHVTHVIPIDKVHKTVSGKKRRFKLQKEYLNGQYDDCIEKMKIELDRMMNNHEEEREAPINEVEAILSDLWCKVFHNTIGIHDNFFDIGGDSLTVFWIIGKIDELLKVDISPSKFVQLGSIRAIGNYIIENKREDNLSKYPTAISNKEEINDLFPLTEVQFAYLTGRDETFKLGGISTHIYYEIETSLEMNKFNESLNKVIKNQPMLRAVVLKSGKQKILESVPEYQVIVEDISGFDLKRQEERILKERERMSHDVFDTEKWPLFEFKALRTSMDKYYLFMGIDLLIADGSSIQILVKEIMDNYDHIQKEKKIIDFTFRDYVLALEDFKKSDIYKQDKAYWMSKVEDFPSAPMVPLKNNPERIHRPHFKRCEKIIDKKLWTNIKDTLTAKGITTSVFLLTMYAKVLAFWSNQSRLAINLTVSNRYPFHEDVSKLIGDFTSVVLLSIDLKEGSTFWENAKVIQDTLFEALEHRHYDGISFIRDISKEKEMNQEVVMPIVFTSMLFAKDKDKNQGIITDLGHIKMGLSQTSQVYLDYQVMELDGQLSITWDYISELFEEEMINNMFTHYVHGVEQLVHEEDYQLEVGEKTREVIDHYNRVKVKTPKQTIQHLFMDAVKKYPENIAVIKEDLSMTYEMLDKKSNQVATYLREKGICRKDIVGVLGERKIETIVNIVGVLKAGAAYVAVDPEHPKDRRDYILSHSDSKIFITSDLYEEESLNAYSDKPLAIDYSPEDVAYIIYTSGSTGRPKGVVITHDAALNTIIDINNRYGVTEEDRIIGLSSMCFDLSVYDIFGSLICGAALVQIDDLRDVKGIIDVLKNKGITIWNSVPAIMDMAIENMDIASNHDVSFWQVENDASFQVDYSQNNDLRLVMLSGDWIPLQLPEKVKEVFTNSQVISLGGATEASIWSIYYPIYNIDSQWKSIPYGYPLSNQAFYVLNYEKNLCPIGVTGELYIGGRGVAKGYMNDEEKTKAAFIEHPQFGFLYRTGDYGVLKKEGYIEFLGRKDHQVKISGHRIELGEIENRMMEHGSIQHAVVLDQTDDNGKKYLCAYIVSDGQVEMSELDDFIKGELPDYMIPRHYIRIDEVPLTANGKVNKKVLPTPHADDLKEMTYIAPRNDMERQLGKIWSNILHLGEIGVTESFLKLGGDSIMMVKAISKISEAFHVDITFKEFMASNTIEKLADIVASRESAETLVKYKKHDSNMDNMHECFPLTDVQMAYFMGRNEGFQLGGVSTHGYYEIETTLDMETFNESLNKVIKQQPMLRAIVLRSGQQKILESVPDYKVVVEDISNLDRRRQEERILKERERMSHDVFDTEKWPLFEFTAMKINEDTHYLFMGLDLLVTDGSSMGIFIRDIMNNYHNPHDKKENMDFTFRDYVLAFEDFKTSDTYKKDREYWMSKVEDFPAAPLLPLKQPVENIGIPHFKRCEKIIDKKRWLDIKKKAKEHDITPSALLCTAYAQVLGYWSNQPHHGLNVTVFTRYPFHEDVNKLIGDFTSIILLEVDLEEKSNFWETAKKIQHTLLESFEHRHYDGMNVIREIAKEKEMSQQAVMPIVFTSLLFSMDNEENGGSFGDLGDMKMGVSQTSQVYLDYQVMEIKGDLAITWDYVDELFDEEMIHTIFGQYVHLVESLADGEADNLQEKNTSTRSYSEYKLDVDEKTRKVIDNYNHTEEDVPKTTIQNLFMSAAKAYPDNIAVIEGDSSITYQLIDKKSNQVAAYLKEKGIGRNDVVGVLGARKIETIINILGILKAGGAYVAVDPEYPKDRKNYILNNSDSKLFITPDLYEEEHLDGYEAVALAVDYSEEDLAYIIYTSGSTGKPKGVMITHDAALNTIIDINHKFNVTEKDRIIGLSSMCFDLSVYDIFGALICGAALVQISDLRDVKDVIDSVNNMGVTIWNSVPAIMDMTIENMDAHMNTEVSFWQVEHDTNIAVDCVQNNTLRLVMLSGDWIPLQLPEKVKDIFPHAEVISLGGATEASIWSIYYPVDDVDSKWKSIPYGYPLSNQTFYVLNYEKDFCPIGVSGELYIGGRGLSKGYINDEEKTEASFMHHPTLGHLYRTGDYGVLTEEGYIEFLGRKDHQVKISGHRIELGEIENRMMAHGKINNALVIDRADDGKKYLCAYMVSDEEINIWDLEQFIREELPEYMMPKYFIRIDEVPLTANGKVNKKVLPAPNVEALKEKNYIAPRNHIESALANIWGDILHSDDIGVTESFLKLGGDSIMMVRAISKISEFFKTEITFKEFMTSNTIEKLAGIIASRESSEDVVKYKKYDADRANIREQFPLTDVQMAYFMGRNDAFELGGISTHGYYEIETTLDIETFNDSLNKVIKHQPMLRAVVLGNGRQKILDDVSDYKVLVEDISSLDMASQEERILEERERMSHHVFDTQTWPLFEFKALRIKKDTYYLFMGIDLLIADGSSMRILVREIMDHYYGLNEDAYGTLEEDIDFTFRDYVLAFDDFKGSELYAKDKAYWGKKVEDFPSAPMLPLKQSIENIKTPHFRRCQKMIDKHIWRDIKKKAKENNITPSALLCTAYAQILGYWSNQPHHGLNVTVFTRYPFHEDVNKIIGDFTSVILLEVDLKEESTFWEKAENIQHTLLESFEHRHYDGINFIREISKQKEMGQQAVMPIVFTSLLFSMENDENNASFTDLGDIKMGVSQTSQVYLDYQVMELNGDLSITWDYVHELFDEEMINTMFHQYVKIVESLAQRDVQMSQNKNIESIGEHNKHKEIALSGVLKAYRPEVGEMTREVIKNYNDTDQHISRTTIQQLFVKAAKKYPDNIAVIKGDSSITYATLDKKSNQVASYLRERGIGRNDFVGILGERKIETIVNILGVLKAGGAYVAVDPDYPKDRQDYILNKSDCKLLMTPHLYEEESLEQYSNEALGIDYSPDDLAYTIYTSGSTGKPKGVMITHDAALNTIIDINNRFDVTDKDRMIGLSSMCFDLSVYDIFGSLICGAALVQISDLRDVKHIHDTVEKENVTLWNSVPAIMDLFIDDVSEGYKNTNLRLVMLSGDWIPLQLPEKVKRVFPNTQVMSLGGATEASIWSIYYPIKHMDSQWKSVPYGYPLSNQRFYVLNYEKDFCPIGVTGELYIGGRGLSKGYMDEEEKTKAVFINHPELGPLYRTGDYGALTKEGYIAFMGRKDHQVKISGHRIELGEIENRLMDHREIRNSLVMDRVDSSGKKYLCAYVVSDKEVEVSQLESFVREVLPEYMVPKYFVKIDEVPLTTNGKVNKKALPEPKRDGLIEKNHVAPRNNVERDLVAIWRDLLNLDEIGITDSFLKLGGDSIMMVRTISRMSQHFNVDITFKEFMKEKTIENLAKLIVNNACQKSVAKYKQYDSDSEEANAYFPLTDVQMAYLMGRNNKFELGGVSTHGYYEVETILDMEIFNESLNRVISHQPMLRAVVLQTGEQKILESVPEYKVLVEDIRSLDRQRQKERILHERERMSHDVFDTETWPLFEFKALKINEDTHYLFMGIDLLIADGSSMGIFMKEIMDNYHIINTQDTHYLNEELDFTFRDYVLSFEDFKKSDTYIKDRAYWMHKVEDFPAAPMLPLKQSVGDIETPHFRRLEKMIDKRSWCEIKRRAKENNITPSALLCAAYAQILGYWSNQPHHGLNVTVFTRYPFHEDVDKIIGDFTSVILLEVDLREGNTFWEKAKNIQHTLLESFEHRHFDGVNVIREISKEKEMGQRALMPIVFTSLLFSVDNSDNDGFFTELGDIKMGISQTSQVYLDYQVMELEGNLSITWDYVDELFDEEMIRKMFAQYVHMVEALAQTEAFKLEVEEKPKRFIADYNNTKDDISPTTIQTLFDKAVKEYAENIAVIEGESTITYDILDKRSNQVALYLMEKGIGRNDVVGVLGARKIETIVNIIGILKAGAAYVAVNPEYPEDRKDYILMNSGSKLYMTPNLYEEENLQQYAYEDVDVHYSPDDVAYIIYTSGSTGKPKGVVITHDAALNTIMDINKKFNVTEEDRIIGLSSMCFDLSVYDIFGSLICGAALVHIQDIKDVEGIIDVITNNEITIWNSVPAIMDMTIENMDMDLNNDVSFWQGEKDTSFEVNLNDNSSLRLVMLSGDWIPLALPDKVKEVFPNAEVISLGGATEASIWSIYYPIKRIESKWKSIPYGYPLSNQSFYVLNYEKEFCPVGVPGELYIGGRGVAKGYMHDEEKTKAAFINHSDLGLLYRTGDYGVLSDEGYIEFLGRKDNQVKISGHRIELGEIENRLMDHREVRNALVMDRTDHMGKKYLCAYIVSDQEIDFSELESFVKEDLPEYMIPKYVIKIEEVPITANGKVNKKMLPVPNAQDFKEKTYVAPRNHMEKKVAKIWSDILKYDHIGVKDNFFKIGGDSVGAIKLYSNLNKEFQLNVNDIFMHPTISELTKVLKVKDNKYKFEQYIADYNMKNSKIENALTFLDKEYKDYMKKNSEKYSDIDLSELNEYKNIFITGATGFVGINLLYQFLENTNATIFTLIRGNSFEQAKVKLERKMLFYFGEDFYDNYKSRIEIVKGDLCHPNFEISDEGYANLAEKIECVINCAANVSHFGEYDDFYKDNVRGVEEIIRFAKKGRVKDLYHMSTSYVGSGAIKDVDNILFTEYDLDVNQTIDNFYAQSKLEAEKLLIKAREDGVNANIFRLGNVTFNSEDGSFQENIGENAFYSLMNTLLNLGVMPESNLQFLEFSYVDYVSRAIFLLLTRKQLRNEIHHIHNSLKISSNELCNILSKLDVGVQKYKYEKFLNYLYENQHDDVHKEEVENLLLHMYLMPWHTDTIYVNVSNKTEELLSRIGFNWKKPDVETIHKMINYGKDFSLFNKVNDHKIIS